MRYRWKALDEDETIDTSVGTRLCGFEMFWQQRHGHFEALCDSGLSKNGDEAYKRLYNAFFNRSKDSSFNASW